MQVSELMHQGVITAQISDSIKKVAKLMKEHDIGAVPVLDHETPAGFVTDRDIALSFADDDATMDDTIASAMTPEFFAIAPDKDVTEAARIMEEKQISRLLVVDGQKPVGMVTLQDLSSNIENIHLKAEIIEEIKQ